MWEESKIKTTLLLCWKLPDRAQFVVVVVVVVVVVLSL